MTKRTPPAVIRPASPEDAAALLDIYAPYVRETAITYEYEVPSLEDFRARIRRTLERYPYLVAEEAGEIVGYAYAGPFKNRAAYDWAVETSVYLRMDWKRRGVGGQLYRALEDILKKQNVRNLYACVACPAAEGDAYLTRNSVDFHTHMGWRAVGEFRGCGYKFGTWYNIVWMEKRVGELPVVPGHFIPFPELIDTNCKILKE